MATEIPTATADTKSSKKDITMSLEQLSACAQQLEVTAANADQVYYIMHVLLQKLRDQGFETDEDSSASSDSAEGTDEERQPTRKKRVVKLIRVFKALPANMQYK
jgi:hypothetical protein